MSEIAYTRWLPRAVTAAAVAFAFFAGAAAVKPAAAAFVGVGVGIPGDYYAPAPACPYYYPYGCYGYPASYYTPAAVVAGGWGWGGSECAPRRRRAAIHRTTSNTELASGIAKCSQETVDQRRK